MAFHGKPFGNDADLKTDQKDREIIIFDKNAYKRKIKAFFTPDIYKKVLQKSGTSSERTVKMTNKKPVRANLIIRAAFVFIFIFLFVSVINLQVTMNELRAERDALVEKMEQIQDENDELELRINTPIDEEFIERIARERGFRKPNEIIFKYDIGE